MADSEKLQTLTVLCPTSLLHWFEREAEKSVKHNVSRARAVARNALILDAMLQYRDANERNAAWSVETEIAIALDKLLQALRRAAQFNVFETQSVDAEIARLPEFQQFLGVLARYYRQAPQLDDRT